MNELLALARFLVLAAEVSLFGCLAFGALVARPALAAAPAAPGLASFFAGQLALARGLWVLALALAPLALALQAFVVVEPAARSGLGEIVPLLTETRFGRTWLLRIALLAVLGVLLARGDRWRAASVATSACLLAAGALSGHASTAEGWEVWLRVPAQMLHLLAAGTWLGGLLPFALLLRACTRAADWTATAVAAEATRRFSAFALASVAALIATGSLNAFNLVGSVPSVLGTGYGQLLLLKLGVLVPLLGIGAVNLLRLKPRLLESAALQSPDAGPAMRRLTGNVAVEVALGACVLLIVAHMALTPPALHVQPDWPFVFRWDWSVLDTASRVRDEAVRGMIWAAAGLIVFLGALLLRRASLVAAAAGLCAIIYGGATVLSRVAIDAYPTTYKRPTVAYHAVSVAIGRTLYADAGCARCHGATGYGNGPGAEGLNPRPADLTGAHSESHTAGDLFWWLSYGMEKSAMPGFRQSLSEDERWDLVNYLRALASGERARTLGPAIDSLPWLVAPDFSYALASGATGALSEMRGAKIVLLVLVESAREAAPRLRQLSGWMPRLRARGVEVLVVPGAADPLPAAKELRGILVSEGAAEITRTYALLARSLLDEELPQRVRHAEFLIDRQGYIRARWIPSEGPAWAEVGDVLAVAEALRREKPRAPAPATHVH